MSDFRFETCADADLPRVQDLVGELYVEDPNVSHIRPDVSLTHRHFIEHADKGRLVVFKCAEEVIGYAIVVFFWSNEYSSNIIEIDELFVESEWRSKKVGAKFFNWLRETFNDSSAGWSLQVAHKNVRAADLYIRLGFRPSRNQHMLKIFDWDK